MVRETEVYREVKKINTKKSRGFPHINGPVLKDALTVLIPELTNIFNMSLMTGLFPASWKKATVIPIPKEGDHSKVDNYRPIALLPLPGKMLEKLVHEQISFNLENRNYFTDYQHGFKKNKSTMHAVIQIVNQINYKRERKTPTVAIFINFRKAFDCVSHKIIMEKLGMQSWAKILKVAGA